MQMIFLSTSFVISVLLNTQTRRHRMSALASLNQNRIFKKQEIVKSLITLTLLLIVLFAVVEVNAQNVSLFDECDNKYLPINQNPSLHSILNPPIHKPLVYSSRDFVEASNVLVSDFLVNTNIGPNGANQGRPSIASLGNGKFIIVWYDNRNGDYDIFAQFYDSNATYWGGDFRVNDDDGVEMQIHPVVASDGNGNFVITWRDRRSGITDIYAQRYALDGTLLGSNFKVNDDEEDRSHGRVTIGMDNNGDFMIAWFDYRIEFYDIFAQGFSNDGTRLGNNFRVNESGMGGFPCCRLSIAPDYQGNFMMAWESPGLKKIYARHFSKDGVHKGGTFNVNDDSGDVGKYDVSIASNLNGQFLVVWMDERNETGLNDVFAQAYQKDGMAVGNNFQVNTSNSDSNPTDPVVALDDSGNALVVWCRFNEEYKVIGQRLRFDGTKIGNEFDIHDDADSSVRVDTQVAVDNQGNFVTTWRDSRNNEFDVYAQRVLSNGTLYGNNTKINTDEGSSVQEEPAISTDRSGNFVVVWEDQGHLNGDIYAQRYNNKGEPIGHPFRVNDDEGTAWQHSPAIAQNEQGFIIVWKDVREGERSIYGQRYSKNGSALGQNFHINNTIGALDPSPPAIGVDGRGHFIIAWNAQGNSENNVHNIYAKRYAMNGIVLEDGFRVNDLEGTANETFQAPAVAVDADGNAIIAWENVDEEYRTSIWAQRFSSDGSAAGSNFQVNEIIDEVSIMIPKIAVNKWGNFIILWTAYGSTTNAGFYAQRYDQNGNVKGGNFKITSLNDNNTRNYPVAAVDLSGKFLVAWQEFYDGSWDIFGQRFSSDGTPLKSKFRLTSFSDRDQKSPAIQLSSYKIYSAWSDSRTPGTGLDIWANIQYWDDEEQVAASSFNLYQCYPNPFNASTIIRFNLEKSSSVKIAIFNMLGEEITTIYDGTMPQGLNEVDWSPVDQPSGIYLCRLKGEGSEKTMKMLLIR